MAWKGKFIGAVIGFLITRNVWGAVMGAIVGHLYDQAPTSNFASGARPGVAGRSQGAYISEVFFRTTFALMGHVAKSDGRVTEAEIGAARGLMQELRLGPNEVNAAIACFQSGKAAGYDAAADVERLRVACVMRLDLLRAFMELQLRAALMGNGISPPARMILRQVGDRLGISGIELARMEAALRARYSQREGQRETSGNTRRDRPLAEAYAELEVDPGAADRDVTKAYRRQMSRHHPDKLVANGLPESMAQVAKEKTQRIQEAYEAIRAARNMR